MKIKIAILAAIALGAYSAHADTFSGAFNNDYQTAGNWTLGSVPNTANGATATINGGQAVTYNPGGDFFVGNGGTLEISNGSWTQINSGAWIQLRGGTILVDGGTFNQGTASSNPFNLGGSTGNAFTITSGVANFSFNVNINPGLTFSIQGGTVNSVSHEFDFNNNTLSMSGGTLNTTLITGINSGGAGIFTLSGGVINLSDPAGIYAGGPAEPVNFTVGSTAVINFNGGTSLSTVQNMVTAGVIEYNGTIDSTLSDFNVTQSGGTVSVQLNAVPEPSVFAVIATGAAGLLMFRRRRA